MRKLLDHIEEVVTLFALVSVFIMVCLTVVDTGGRYLLNQPIVGAYEVTAKYLMVFSVFFAFCYAYRQGANIRVTFIVSRLPGKVILLINYFAQIFSVLLCTSLFVTSIIFVIRRFHDKLLLTNYSIPLAPAYISVPVGLFILVVQMTLDLWEVKGKKSGLFKE